MAAVSGVAFDSFQLRSRTRNESVQIGPISPLRQRLLDGMALRRFGLETQRNYLRDVSRFATWPQRSPHTATAEDIRQFQFEQLEAGVPADRKSTRLNSSH